MLSRLSAFIKSPIVRWIAGTVLLISLLLIWRPPITEFLELKLYDLKFRFRGPRPVGHQVAIVAIDDDSIKAVGRWPWSREDIAALILRLTEAGPRVVALDVIFAEKQETLALKTLDSLAKEISRQGDAPPQILHLIEAEKQRADVDRLLARVLSQGSPTILGFFFRSVGATATGSKTEQSPSERFISSSTYNLVRRLHPAAYHFPLVSASGVERNLPEITQAAAGEGYFNMIPDPDGAVRWFPMTIRYNGDFYAPLSLVSLSHYQGGAPLALILSRFGVAGIRLGRQDIPVDRYGRLLINYLGPPGTVPTYSAKAVLDGTLPPDALRDKIVLLGATAVGVYDLRVTPFSGVFPGVEVQATIMDNLLQGHFIRVMQFHLPIMLIIVLCLGIIMGLVLPRLSAAWAFVFTLILIEVYVAVNYLLFSRAGIQIELFYPVMEIILIYLGVTMQRFLAEEKERERIRKAFESYVAPTVVQEMLKHPEQLRLGGERREISVLFTDIRGFTTLSEDLEPQALVNLLHDFLNPMSNIIISEGGTIDKYMGDAIMALFGAPLPQPEHPAQACRAALQMVATLAELNPQWAAQGRPVLKIGVGVNTGPAAVGNMGSDRLFEYTAIGDNVNLASRLEGLNKFYGTSILVSQTTAAALGNGFILRDIDRVRVKGKAQVSGIYELVGEGEPHPEIAHFLEVYHQGLAAYRERRWPECLTNFQEALSWSPHDKVMQYYMGLAQKWLAHPPEPDWEPVTVMEAK